MVKDIEFEINRIISDNIVRYLDTCNKTQIDLSEYVGVSQATVSNWCKGIKMPRMDKIDKICSFFQVSRSDLMEEHNPSGDYPTNAILPSANSTPIMGTICAGTGRICEDDYQGHFVIDIDVKADYCLRIKGDSMVGANIFDGDIVFITKSFDFETGEIYAVEMLDTSEASLKRVHKDGESLVLVPCNSDYTPTVTDYSEVRIAGKCVGVFHKYK